MRFYKAKIILLSAILVVGVLGAPTKSYAALEGCPNNWNIKIPELTFNKFSTLSNNAKVHFYTSSLYGPDNSAKQRKGIGYPLETPSAQRIPRFQGEYALKILLPEVYEKLTGLGKDAIWSSSYEIVNPKINSKSTNQSELEGLFSSPVRPWLLYYLGIGNGTKIKLNLKISIKSCSDFTISSNTYQFENLEISTMTFDDYFKNSVSSTAGSFNFKQEELIRDRLSNNIKLLSNGTLNKDIPLNRIGYTELDGKEFSYLLLGIEPAGCIDSINPNSLPAVNPVSAVVISNPCNVSVVADFNLTEQVNCKSSTCSTDPNYDNLIQKLKSFSGDYWTGDFIQVSTFIINQKVSSTKVIRSITCVKGKLTKKVTGTSPKCPTGYKKA
jgi:hypothetical protein